MVEDLGFFEIIKRPTSLQENVVDMFPMEGLLGLGHS